jgi:hypothetical protein
MAREMFASGDWITTRLNGIKYFEKPPLQTWMNALSFAAFGLGDWQARLWTGLCGLGGVLLTGFTPACACSARASASTRRWCSALQATGSPAARSIRSTWACPA